MSRPAGELVAEVERLAADGVREVTLLGQNVCSYGRDLPKGAKTTLRRASRRSIDAIDGLERIRYTSPHPKDIREDVIRAHAELPSVCEHIHLPLQSGSSRVLKAMRRTYNRERYLDRVAMIRELVPDCAITTDIIVGFPGETDADFEETMEVVEQVRYDSAFTFVFSPRRGTLAAELEDAPAAPGQARAHGAARGGGAARTRPSARSASWAGRWRCSSRARRAPTRTSCADAPATTRRSTSPAWPRPGELTEVEVASATSTTLAGEERLLARAG